MKVDINKLNRQKQGAKYWQRSKERGSPKNGFGTLWYPTGFGKTFTTLNEIVNPVVKKNQSTSVIILVHREKLEKQWKQKIDDFIDDEYIGNITVSTVQHYISHKIKPICDLLIVDEVHKFYEDEYFKYVDGTNIKRKWLLCLTATFNDPHGRHKKLQKICPVVDQITEKEAIDNGWISKYIEYNLGINLTNDEVVKYTAISQKIADNMSKFGDYGFTGANKVLQGDKDYNGFKYALMWANKMGWDRNNPDCIWNPNRIVGYAKSLMKAIRQRKDLLYESDTKLEVVEEIIDKFKQYKIMSFSESTAFADKLAKKLNKDKEQCVVYHSQLKSRKLKDENGEFYTYKSGKKKGQPKIFGIKRLKEIFTDKFINNEVRILSTARALDEGFDCPDIQVGITSSRSSNFNQHTQRGGRIKRIIPEKPNEKMLIINIYFRGTKDYDWLKKAQSKSTNEIHWVSNIDDIDFEFDNSFDLDDL